MSGKEDHILTLIALHRAQVKAASVETLTDDECDRLSLVASATWWRMLDLGPSTRRGAGEYARYVADCNENCDCPTNRVVGNGTTIVDVCSVALRKIADALGQSEATSATDPVFAAIDRCEAAMAENDRLAKLEIGGATPEARVSQWRLRQAGDRWMAAFSMLVATPPTTPRGLEALCSFILRFAEEWGGDDDELISYDEWKSLIKTVRLYAIDSTSSAN